MESLFNCNQCGNKFNDQDNIPKLFPCCGSTLCLACIKSVLTHTILPLLYFSLFDLFDILIIHHSIFLSLTYLYRMLKGFSVTNVKQSSNLWRTWSQTPNFSAQPSKSTTDKSIVGLDRAHRDKVTTQSSNQASILHSGRICKIIFYLLLTRRGFRT